MKYRNRWKEAKNVGSGKTLQCEKEVMSRVRKNGSLPRKTKSRLLKKKGYQTRRRDYKHTGIHSMDSARTQGPGFASF